jgi:hypothetical protein
LELFRRFISSEKLSLTLRLVLGAMIMVAVVPKLLDIEKNSVYLVYSYRILPMYPLNVARLVGSIVPFVELFIGLGLLLGVFTRLSAAAWGILSFIYLLLKIDIIFVQGRLIPCGCFAGILPNLQVTHSIWIDIVTIPLCAQIFYYDRKRRLASIWRFLPERWRQSKLRQVW